MPKLKDVMSPNVEVIKPEATLLEAAEKMKEIDCGSLPVCEGHRLLGMITDRDIVLRALAAGADVDALHVRDVMTSPIVFCYDDQEVSEAAHIMESNQIRRLVVLDRIKRLVGIVSLGDIAVRSGSTQLSGQVLEKISQPILSKAA